jgi:hypothetical protein
MGDGAQELQEVTRLGGETFECTRFRGTDFVRDARNTFESFIDES